MFIYELFIMPKALYENIFFKMTWEKKNVNEIYTNFTWETPFLTNFLPFSGHMWNYVMYIDTNVLW